jgi:two-component system sensor kinase FixL
VKDLLSIYAPGNRRTLLAVAGVSVGVIAAVDFLTESYISLGFLYLFPIMIAGGFLSRAQTVLVAIGCAGLGELFSNLPSSDAGIRLFFSSAGFIGTGLFISELVRNRQIILEHVSALEEQQALRRDAERELLSLVDTSPAAIVTVGEDACVRLANEAACRLLATKPTDVCGEPIGSYLPSLAKVLNRHASKIFRTSMQCRGRRRTGEAFLAGVWFSTYATRHGRHLAAIIVDLSEDLKDREDLRLDHLLRHTRILMSAVAHEVRNLSSTALVVHKNLSRQPALQDDEDFQALSTLIQSLEAISARELQPLPVTDVTAVDLTSVFDEVRVLVDAAFHESAIETEWQIPETLPPVLGERYGLVQVFLNLAKNSQRAMHGSAERRLRVHAVERDGAVTIRVQDTGPGVRDPARLFQPFQVGATSTGLGLYVSRAVVRSFGGDLVYEDEPHGACFAVVLMVDAPVTGENG